MSTMNTVISTPEGTPLLVVPNAPQKKRSRKRIFTRDREEMNANVTMQAKDDHEREKKIKHSEDVPLCQLDLGNGCYLVVNCFRDKTLVHIRIYEKNAKGNIYPNKKGISLDLEKWKKLIERYVVEVDAAIDKYNNETVDFMAHLGSNRYVSLRSGYPCVNIRSWFIPSGKKDLCPSKTGIALNFKQWNQLKEYVPIIKEVIGQELDEVQFCEMREDHQNQMGALTCPNCNPNWFVDLLN